MYSIGLYSNGDGTYGSIRGEYRRMDHAAREARTYSRKGTPAAILEVREDGSFTDVSWEANAMIRRQDDAAHDRREEQRIERFMGARR